MWAPVCVWSNAYLFFCFVLMLFLRTQKNCHIIFSDCWFSYFNVSSFSQWFQSYFCFLLWRRTIAINTCVTQTPQKTPADSSNAFSCKPAIMLTADLYVFLEMQTTSIINATQGNGRREHYLECYNASFWDLMLIYRKCTILTLDFFSSSTHLQPCGKIKK